MSDLNRIFSELKGQCAQNVIWANVEDWLTYDEGDDAALKQRHARKFWSLPMCVQDLATQDYQLQLLRELSNYIRSIRNNENRDNGYNVAHDNWANIDGINPKDYLAYIYAVTSLATLPQQMVQAAPGNINEHINIQLALNSVSTYLLTLTIPGAKSYGIFDEGVIDNCLKLFRLLELNANSSVRANSIWMLFLSICDDLKLLLRFVHFKDHLEPRDNIISCLLRILYMNFRQGYNNSSPFLVEILAQILSKKTVTTSSTKFISSTSS